MVFYFKARPEAGDYTIFMGLDKHENEELIKYGFPEDIWYALLFPFLLVLHFWFFFQFIIEVGFCLVAERIEEKASKFACSELRKGEYACG